MTDKKKELQEKYIELQLYGEQLAQLQKQMELIEEQLMELRYVIQSLGETKNLKVGTELLVPIASGIFLKADLKDKENLIVNVGANTVVTKTVDEAKALLEKQFGELENQHKKVLTGMMTISERAQGLEAEMNELLVDLQK